MQLVLKSLNAIGKGGRFSGPASGPHCSAHGWGFDRFAKLTGSSKANEIEASFPIRVPPWWSSQLICSSRYYELVGLGFLVNSTDAFKWDLSGQVQVCADHWTKFVVLGSWLESLYISLWLSLQHPLYEVNVTWDIYGHRPYPVWLGQKVATKVCNNLERALFPRQPSQHGNNSFSQAGHTLDACCAERFPVNMIT